MNKTYFIALMGLIVSLSACTKKNNTAVNTGSWTFKSATYTAKSCMWIGSVDYLIAIDSSASAQDNYGQLRLSFFGNLPTASKTYLVTSFNRPLNDSVIVLVMSAYGPSAPVEYISADVTGSQTASATMVNGKVRMTGSNIMMRNATNPADSGMISFDISQQ